MSEFENVPVEGEKWSDSIPPPSSSGDGTGQPQQPAGVVSVAAVDEGPGDAKPADQPQPAEPDQQAAGQQQQQQQEQHQQQQQQQEQQQQKEQQQQQKEQQQQQQQQQDAQGVQGGAEDEETLEEAFKNKTELQSAFQSLTKQFVDTQADVHVQQTDKSSPLYAAMEFDDVGKQPNTLPINENVLKAARMMNYKKPSKIQSTALPLLLKNPPENLVFQSQPGTGKTAAFTMNMLTRIDPSKNYTQALYVCPTFQLCFQTSQVIEALAQFTGIQVGLLFSSRDADASAQVGNVAEERGMAQQQVLCCTIKKLVTSIKQRKHVNPRNIRILVVDEADAMLESPDNFSMLKQLKRQLPRNVQVVMLSATFPNHVMKVAHEVAPSANIITIPKEEVTVKDIKQLYIATPTFKSKIDALDAIYENLNVKQAIVFCNTRRSVGEVTQLMRDDGHQVSTISSSLTKSEQLQQLDRFLQGLDNVLVCTDMLSRGIDIPQISIVVNFDVPIRFAEGGGYAGPGFETYAHRIGRLGCFRGGGAAITFVQTRNDLQVLEAIAEHYKCDINEVTPSEEDLKAQTELTTGESQ